MKYVVLVPDGAADYPLDDLDGRTPLEAAKTPNLDRLASEGNVGLVNMIPPEHHPGSDVGNLEIFGYDTREYYTGRAPLEAASMGVELGPDDIAFRLNTINRNSDILVDYSAGHISTEESHQLMQELTQKIDLPGFCIHPGIGYRHLLVLNSGPGNLKTVPPHDIMGCSIEEHLPSGKGSQQVCHIMDLAEKILSQSSINTERIRRGELPANAIWLWGPGRSLSLPSLKEKYGFSGGVISAVDLVRGIGSCAGLRIVNVPGATGYLDTNYRGKAEHALQILQDENFVYLHIEAPDEASHNGDVKAKIKALEDIDTHVVGPLIKGVANLGPCRLLVTPDHPTPIKLRTHSRDPVPFLFWGHDFETDDVKFYSEKAALESGRLLKHGYELIELLRGSSSLP